MRGPGGEFSFFLAFLFKIRGALFCWRKPDWTCSKRGMAAMLVVEKKRHACWWRNSRAGNGLPRKIETGGWISSEGVVWRRGSFWLVGFFFFWQKRGEKQSKPEGVFLRSKLEEFPSRRRLRTEKRRG